MPGTHLGERAAGYVAPLGRHVVLPVGVVAVPDGERHGTSQRPQIAHAREDLRLVAFDLLPRTPSVPRLTQGKIFVDLRKIERQPRRKPLDDAKKPFPVRFAGCCDVHDVLLHA